MTQKSPRSRSQTTDENAPRVYDNRALTYSETFDSNAKRQFIMAMEWMTGKMKVIGRVRRFENMGTHKGQAFWPATMTAMGIEVQTPQDQLEHIPETGPVVFVANHPHGMVDGMILADLIGRRRNDYRILTRSLLTGIDESAASYMIPVPFPHQDDAQRKMIEMRARAMEHLGNGGLIALFPSGVVATSKTMWGPVIEEEWNVFTAKMIKRSGATVVPIYFPGQNSRWYQVANQVSPMLRQGLLIHEVIHACNKPQTPVVGKPIGADEVRDWTGNQREFVGWLRDRTLALAKSPD